MIRSAARRLAAATAALAGAGPASAHGTLAESADFYAGALHPFLAWEHTILLIGLGLMLGRPLGPVGRWSILCLVAGLAAGLLVEAGLLAGAAPIAILLAGLLAGGVIAAGLSVPQGVRAAFAGIAGLLVGIDTDVAMSMPAGPLAGATPLLGVVTGCLLIVLNMMALSSLAKAAPWTIGVRIAGSWIVAVAFLVLAVTLTRVTAST